MKNIKTNQIYNPFLPLNEYVPDGEPHVFGDRVYLFGSHDKEKGDAFCMLDYVGYSAPVTDLTDWRYEGVIYTAKQDPYYSSERQYMYAPDVVRGNDGRYYLYYGLEGFSSPISVAVCDTPTGKYEYYGYVRNADGSVFKRFIPFDPAVLNDDGIIRLYYGWSLEDIGGHDPNEPSKFDEKMINLQVMLFNKTRDEVLGEPESIMGANTVTLADDMLTVTSEPVRIVPGAFFANGTTFEKHAFFEGSSIRKVGHLYYFIYSSEFHHELCYAVSKYPDRDFVCGGTIVSNGDIGYKGRKAEERLAASGNNHGSIEYINGQWYVFYHRQTHGTEFSRQACAEAIEILPDGSIPQVEITSCGLNKGPLLAIGEYPAVIACNLTNGNMPHLVNKKEVTGIPCVTSSVNERYITGIENGTLIGFKYFKFQEPVKLTLKVKGEGDGKFVISTSSKELGQIEVTASDLWKEISTIIDTKGTESLNLTYLGNGSIDLLELKFENI